MKLLLITTLTLTLAVVGFAESSDEAAVRVAHQDFVKAAKTGDATALGKLLGDGLQYSHSSTKVETKQECIAALVKSHGNLEVHSQAIHVYGKAASIRAKVTSHGAAGDTSLTILSVWVKNGEDWQMVERQATRVPAP